MEELNLNKSKIQFTSSHEQIFASQGDVLLYSLNKSINLKSANKILFNNEVNTFNLNQKGCFLETTKTLDIKSNDLLTINTNNGLKINLVGEKDFEINFLEDIQNFKIKGFQNDFLIDEFKTFQLNSKKILLNEKISIDKSLNIQTDVLVNNQNINFESQYLSLKNKNINIENKTFYYRGYQTNFETEKLGFKTSKLNFFSENTYFENNQIIFHSFQKLNLISKNEININCPKFFINDYFKILENQLLTNLNYINFSSNKFKITSPKISLKNNQQKIKFNDKGLSFKNISNLNFNIKGNSFLINENLILFKSWDGIGIHFDSTFKPILFNSEIIIKKEDETFLEILNHQTNIQNESLSLNFQKINITGDIFHQNVFKTEKIEVNEIYPKLLQTVKLISGESNLNQKIFVNEKVKIYDVEEIGFKTLNLGNVILINENEFFLKKEKINIVDQILIGSGKFLIKPFEINNFEIDTKNYLLKTDVLDEFCLRKNIKTDIYQLTSQKINLSTDESSLVLEDEIKLFGRKILMNNLILDDNVLFYNNFGKIFLEKEILFEIQKSFLKLNEDELKIKVSNINFENDVLKIGNKFLLTEDVLEIRKNINLFGNINLNNVLKINKNFELNTLRHEIKCNQSSHFGKEIFYDFDKFICQFNHKFRIYNPHKSELILDENINLLSKNITLEALENIHLNSNLITNNLKLNENFEYLGGNIVFNTKGYFEILMTKNISIETTTGDLELKTSGFNFYSDGLNQKTFIKTSELTLRTKDWDIETSSFKLVSKDIEIFNEKKLECVLGDVKIENLNFHLYQTGKEGIKLISDGGKIEIEGKEEILIKSLYGEVLIEKQSLSFSHENILIDTKKYQIDSQEFVVESNFNLSGYFSINGDFSLRGNVEIESQEIKMKSLRTLLTTGEFLLDSQKNEINGQLKVNGGMKVFGEMECEVKKNKFILEGETLERGSFQVLEMSNHHLSSILLESQFGGIELKSPEFISLNSNLKLKNNELLVEDKSLIFNGKLKIDVLEVNEIICQQLEKKKKEEIKPPNPYFKLDEGKNPIHIRLDAQSYLKQGLKIFMENEKDIEEKVGIYVEGKGKNIICDGTIETQNIIFDFDGKKELKKVINELFELVKKQEKKIEELENRLKN